MHDLGWIFFTLSTTEDGVEGAGTNKHKVTLPRLARCYFARLLDYLLHVMIYLALSLLQSCTD